MTIEEAKEELTAYRKKQRELRKKIDALRDWLRKNGVNPDAPPVDLRARNQDMYNRYLNGESYKELAKLYRLSYGRVRGICFRIEYVNERKARKEREG